MFRLLGRFLGRILSDGGFDTHAGQAPRHANLLRQLGDLSSAELAQRAACDPDSALAQLDQERRAQVEDFLGLSGDEILYVGDHLFGDVHFSKALLRWRTALILRELESEVDSLKAFRPEERKLEQLMADKTRLEAELAAVRLALQRDRLGYASPPEGVAPDRTRLELLRIAIADLDEATVALQGMKHLETLVDEGRLRLTSSGVTTADTLLPSAEAILRDLLLGQEWLRAQGMKRAEALTVASNRRFRPIMMTAITTIGGMIPLALAGSGGGDDGLSYTSFSLTLIGGMTTATLLTLLVVPVMYSVSESFRRLIRHTLGLDRRSVATPEPARAR